MGNKKSVSKMLIETEKGVSLGGASQIVDENKKGGKTIEVNINKIDEIIPKDRHISILQLDVEGYEKEALSGAIETIKRCKPILILEDNNKIIDTEWFKERILNIGYQEKGKIHANTLLMINDE